jgi:hypothetical protein
MPFCKKKDDKVFAYKNKVDDTLKEVKDHLDVCNNSFSDLKSEQKELHKLLDERYSQNVKKLQDNQDNLKNLLKDLKKLKKNSNIELIDIVIQQDSEDNVSGSVVIKSKKQQKKEEKKQKKEDEKNQKEDEKKQKEDEKKQKEDEKKQKEDEKKQKKEDEKKQKKEDEKKQKKEKKSGTKEVIVVSKKNSKAKTDFDPVGHAALLISTNDSKKSSGIEIMKTFLMEKQDFKETDIIVLSGKNATKVSILKELEKLQSVSNEKDCKELIIYYSGNGTVVTKNKNTESVLVPIDYKSKGYINTETFTQQFNTLKEDVNISILLDCNQQNDFTENAFEYSGSIENSTSCDKNHYTPDIVTLSLRKLQFETKKKGIIENNHCHILAKAFIEHYGECVEEKRENITMISMLHDIRDYLVYHETELMPVLSTCGEVDEESSLIKIIN